MKPPAQFRFRLYVAGTTANSVQAITNLMALCRAQWPDRHEVEVVDVLRHPFRAQADGVFITPMLVKHAPAPVCRIIGTLSQPEKVLRALGEETRAA